MLGQAGVLFICSLWSGETELMSCNQTSQFYIILHHRLLSLIPYVWLIYITHVLQCVFFYICNVVIWNSIYSIYIYIYTIASWVLSESASLYEARLCGRNWVHCFESCATLEVLIEPHSHPLYVCIVRSLQPTCVCLHFPFSVLAKVPVMAHSIEAHYHIFSFVQVVM